MSGTQTINDDYMGTISIADGDSLTVTSTGTIEGPNDNTYPWIDAVQGPGSVATISNSGLITGEGGINVNGDVADIENIGGTISTSYDVAINIGGSLGNLTNTGTILTTNWIGIEVSGDATITNSGEIEGLGSNGIAINGKADINNTGIIAGDRGIQVGSNSIIENAGSISTTDLSQDAILLDGNDSTLILDAGSQITGNVVDDAGDGNLELGGTGFVSVTGIGSGLQYQGFSTFAFDNPNARVEGNASGLASGQEITGFAVGDTIILDGVASDGATYVDGTGLELDNGGGTLDIVGAFDTSDFIVTTDGTNTTIEVACYYPGTMIRTPTGDVEVENLSAGDIVSTADGRQQPVRWIGRMTVSIRFADPLRVLPIRIRKGAIGDNLPERDLLLSPDHAILFDDILIQAGALVNDLSIIRERDVPDTFTYYHVELADHALILAEGAPTETFVDNVTRMGFDNWDEHQTLFPTGEPIIEMDLPRAQSLRQVPLYIRQQMRDRARVLVGTTETSVTNAVAA